MVLVEQSFKAIYQQLNTQQKLAVDTIDGPVMVIAGPGTGKTQVLAARVANILLKTDTKPHNILALTFTDAAAKNMRERVVQMIGKTGYYVQITTFHAFCLDVIQTHPEYFSLTREAQALGQIERFGIFEDILESEPLTVLKPINAPLFYLRDCIKAISDLKREGLTPSAFEKIVQEEQQQFATEAEEYTKTQRVKAEKNIAKHQDLQIVYRRYQEKLLELHRYDFDDMILMVMEAFKEHEDLLLEYQENIHYFLVDEYQDTNAAQNTVVSLLASYWQEAANIFVVGDPNQAIYRFQGASVENMLGFIDQYPQAQVVTLEVGYRAPQVVYDAAHELIKNNTLQTTNVSAKTLIEQVEKRLVSQQIQQSGSIKLVAAASDVAETIQVASAIEEYIAAGVAPEEIAVIYRNNADSISIQEILGKKNIRYEIAGGRNVLETEAVQQLLRLLELIVTIRSGETPTALFEVFSYEWLGLNRLAVLELTRFAGTQRLQLTDVLEKDYTFYKEGCETCLLSLEEWQAIKSLLDKLKIWGLEEIGTNISQWFAKIIDESGYLEWIKTKEDSFEVLMDSNTIFNELKSQQTVDTTLKLETFLANIRLMREHKISLQAEDFNITQGAVKLTTAHSAKGQEWRHVFIIKCADGKWGNSLKRDILPLPDAILRYTDISKKEKNEDDRRLFYVALTRAKETIQLSYAKTTVQNSSNKEAIGSMFIEEIKPLVTDITQQETDKVATLAKSHIEELLKPRQHQLSSQIEISFYQAIVGRFALSITALNDYLRDPSFFVYKHLIRVPEPRSEAQAYGTAMHRALEFLYRQWCLEKKAIVVAEVLQEFERYLLMEAIHLKEFERRLQIGRKHLQAYCENVLQTQPQVIFLEKTFGRGFSTTYLDDIQLVGRIDRIDWLDKSNKTAVVIDYKTGRPKSHQEIAGNTSTSQKDFSPREKVLPDSIRGPYKRQLLFYKLLGDLDTSFIPTIIEGQFDFVEPDKTSGKFIRRQLALEQQEVEELKSLIKEVMAEIRSLAFLDTIS